MSAAQLAADVASHVDAFRSVVLSHVPRPVDQSSDAKPQWCAGQNDTLFVVPSRLGMHALELYSDQSTDQFAGSAHGSPFIIHDGDGSTGDCARATAATTAAATAARASSP